MEAVAHEWLTVREFAQHYRVSARTVARWIAADPSMQVRRIGPTGRTIRIHKNELDRFLPAAA